ncbi:MAG TPA: hypothetical protein VNJ70_09775 [Thermoanaerobaculia bacterium]|nr:hypothetical protein [Thermoanaerobaculia bacterium]
MDSYNPTSLARWLGLGETRKERLASELDEARKNDAADSAAAERRYQEALADYHEQRELAERLLAGDVEALMEVIREFNLFSAISALGSSVQIRALPNLRMAAELQIHGEDCIPRQALTLLKSGRASTKKLPKGDYYRLHQDYVCSAVLRVARELFALTPVEAVTVTATDMVLNSTTGHLEPQALLSAFIPRATFERLDLNRVDPSDCFRNFLHNMNFRPSTGLGPVDPLDPERVGPNG